MCLIPCSFPTPRPLVFRGRVYFCRFPRRKSLIKKCFLLSKNMNFNKNEKGIQNGKSHIEPCTSAHYRNRELKVKLWWVGARKRKTSAFFVTFILSDRIFFNIYVLSQCRVYWINFQNIYTFTYKKHYCIYIFACF